MNYFVNFTSDLKRVTNLINLYNEQLETDAEEAKQEAELTKEDAINNTFKIYRKILFKKHQRKE